MPTNELSDALNPYASQARRPSNTNDQIQSSAFSYPPVAQVPLQPLTQHNQWQGSELQNAMVEVEPIPPAIRPQQGAQRMFAELVRIIAATQNAQEAEAKRRQEWELEQEMKASQQRADMEQKMLDLQAEIVALRTKLDASNNQFEPPILNLPTPQFTPAVSFMPHPNANMGMTSPISPISQPSPFQQPMFVQGSSNDGLSHTTNYYPRADPTHSATQPNTYEPPHIFHDTGLQSITPDPSPHLTSVEASRTSPSPSTRPSSKRRRRRRSRSRSPDDSDSSSSSASSGRSRPRKRVSHHDTRCYTIHHAMRLHMLRMMDIETDKELPDSHVEGTSLSSSEPIRFVWDKTTKQSVHNARMKTRILEDIKDRKRLYKHVDRKDFGKKPLDGAFEACFTTMRQKFRSQRDEKAAEHQKKREDNKARKSRHLSRRKAKLTNRSEARNRIPTFEHVTFDSALQVDCMSSEESDLEADPHSSQPNPILKCRGYGWRSARLLRFYCLLDDEEAADATTRLRRGQGKRERRIGPIKDEFILPPTGVATWMISRRWYKASLSRHQDLPEIISKLVDDAEDFNWDDFAELGDASADEAEYFTTAHQQYQGNGQQLQWEPIQVQQPSGTHITGPMDNRHNYTYAPTYTF